MRASKDLKKYVDANAQIKTTETDNEGKLAILKWAVKYAKDNGIDFAIIPKWYLKAFGQDVILQYSQVWYKVVNLKPLDKYS